MYVDMEHAHRDNPGAEKFSTRSKIGDLFEHLWAHHGQRKTWRTFATQNPQVYAQFCSQMLNDGIYLLDTTIRLLPQMKADEETLQNAEALRNMSKVTFMT